MADAREESLVDVAVDLHSGWTTTGLTDFLGQLHGSQEAGLYPETRVALSLAEACGSAIEVVRRAVAPRAQAREVALRVAAAEEQAQVARHYQTIIERLEASKGRKRVSLDRIEDKIRSATLDRERRLEDVARRYRQVVEKEAELLSYVQKLEQRYDAAAHEEGPMPTPQEMVQELERYLKRRIAGEGPGTTPQS